MKDEDPGFGTPAGERGALPSDAELLACLPERKQTPKEHQQVKDIVNGSRLQAYKGHGRRYLVAGAGRTSDAWEQRVLVYKRLDCRSDADALKLEELGLRKDEIHLWAHVFDILCGISTQIVAVIEDFDGGYTWELGLMFAGENRDKTWILKRKYEDEDTERERYDNSMAASHIQLLLTGDRVHEWHDTEDLRQLVPKIP